jgi:hypothetical protein
MTERREQCGACGRWHYPAVEAAPGEVCGLCASEWRAGGYVERVAAELREREASGDD